MLSHVFMADVGHSGQQIMSYYADSAWSCVGNDMPFLFKRKIRIVVLLDVTLT